MKKHVGIDVSKRFFDVHLLETGQDWHFDYVPEQLAECVKTLKDIGPDLIVLEATGGYERELVLALQLADLPVAVVNPRRVRDFARATGQLGKTDKLDAKAAARYGEAVEVRKQPPMDPQRLQLKDLVARRNQLLKLRTVENNHREHAADRIIARSIKTIIKVIDSEIEKVEKQIDGHINKQPALKLKAEILKSAPGIGQTTAFMMVVELPELGHANDKEIAALVGVAPLNRDSGMFRGKRMTGGGRREVRTRLFMPTLVAIQHNPVIRRFYLSLLARGKPKMTAVIAAMRKLLVILNRMVQKNEHWNPKLT